MCLETLHGRGRDQEGTASGQQHRTLVSGSLAIVCLSFVKAKQYDQVSATRPLDDRCCRICDLSAPFDVISERPVLHDVFMQITLARFDGSHIPAHDIHGQFGAACRSEQRQRLCRRHALQFSIEPIRQFEHELSALLWAGINVEMDENGFEGHGPPLFLDG